MTQAIRISDQGTIDTAAIEHAARDMRARAFADSVRALVAWIKRRPAPAGRTA